jgi:ATP-dependent DNA ligase
MAAGVVRDVSASTRNYAFDLLQLDCIDLRKAPIEDRKGELASMCDIPCSSLHALHLLRKIGSGQ